MNHNRFSKFIDTTSTFYPMIEKSTRQTFYKTSTKSLNNANSCTSCVTDFNKTNLIFASKSPTYEALNDQENKSIPIKTIYPRCSPYNITQDEKEKLLVNLRNGYNANSKLKKKGFNTFYTKPLNPSTLIEKDTNHFKKSPSKCSVHSANPENSNAETDDTIFALSELKTTDKKIEKRLKKTEVWKDKSENIYDTYASNNHKLIKDVQRRVRQFGGWQNFDLKQEVDHKKYFPLEKVDIILDAEKIMNNKAITYLNEKKAFENLPKGKEMNLYTFTRQNRQIFLDNIILNILHEEKKKINKEEAEIKKALDSAKDELAKDIKSFDDFRLIKKMIFKEINLKLDERIRNNKYKREQIRRLASELKSTQDEIEKNIRNLIVYKVYADFIHSVLGHNERMANSDLSWINLQSKDKDLEQILEKIFENFQFVLDEDISLNTDILNNGALLTNSFTFLEKNILKSLEILEDIRNKRYTDKKHYDLEIDNLKNRLMEENKEYEEYKNELKIEQEILGPNVFLEKNLNIYNKLLLDIYDCLSQNQVSYSFNNGNLSNSGIINNTSGIGGNNETTNLNQINTALLKKKNDIKNQNLRNEELVRESQKLMKNLEECVNGLIEEMEIIEKDSNSDGLFKNLVEGVKNENRIKKYIESRELFQKEQEEKNLKYQQRQNRLKIKGQFSFPPPWILNKKKKDDTRKKKVVVDENEMLVY